jgi:hypothetical protein
MSGPIWSRLKREPAASSRAGRADGTGGARQAHLSGGPYTQVVPTRRRSLHAIHYVVGDMHASRTAPSQVRHSVEPAWFIQLALLPTRRIVSLRRMDPVQATLDLPVWFPNALLPSTYIGDFF